MTSIARSSLAHLAAATLTAALALGPAAHAQGVKVPGRPVGDVPADVVSPADDAEPGRESWVDENRAALETFRALSFRQKAILLRNLERGVRRDDHAAIQRLLALVEDPDDLPAASPIPVYDPGDVEGARVVRQPVTADTAAHEAVRKRYPRVPYLDDLHAVIRYDWTTRTIVREPRSLGYDETFANYLAGYPPGADEIVARVLAAFDADADKRMAKLANWFGHAYCDLDGGVYDGVTLYESWYSGKVVDVPDVDALPFAWNILRNRRYKYPLGGPSRDRLYDEIRDAALEYRIHRSLCEAAAASVVAADPIMEGTYGRLVPRFHYLFAVNGDSLDAVVRGLRGKNRDAVLAEVDAAIRDEEGDAWETREGRKKELAEMAKRIRARALTLLRGVAK